MNRLLMLAAALLVQETKPQPAYPTSQWEIWQGFGEGSSTTLVIESGGEKTEITTTLIKREKDQITLESVMKEKGGTKPAEQRVVTPPPKAEAPAVDGDCSHCKKPMKDHKKPLTVDGTEKITIGDQKIDCLKRELTSYDCDGKAEMTSTTWYSSSVPGFMVKGEKKTGEKTVKVTCTAFVKR